MYFDCDMDVVSVSAKEYAANPVHQFVSTVQVAHDDDGISFCDVYVMRRDAVPVESPYEFRGYEIIEAGIISFFLGALAAIRTVQIP